MHLRSLLAVSLWAGFCAAPISPAFADTREGDWSISCTQNLKPVKQTCQMFQAPPSPDGGAPHFLMSVSATDKGNLYGVITAPLSVYLVPGVEMSIDKRSRFKALFELCDTAGCHAGFRLTGQVLDAFRKGTTAQMRVWVSKKQAIEVPVSLKGFAKATQQLQGAK